MHNFCELFSAVDVSMMMVLVAVGPQLCDNSSCACLLMNFELSLESNHCTQFSTFVVELFEGITVLSVRVVIIIIRFIFLCLC